jgi:uridine phosphorylase
VPFPQHPKKHLEAALVTASEFHRYEAKHSGSPSPKPPRSVVLVFGSRWRQYLNRKYRGRIDPRTGIYRPSESVGIARISGPGAPFATIVVEELAALGVREFLIVGLAGSLRPNLEAGSLVVCAKALRDEGTSYHYAKASSFAHPSPRLLARLKRTLNRNRVSFAEGPSWTTDAPYRETVAEIRRFRRMGILTVEMEASAVFTVAQHLGRTAAALFVISDHLEEDGWKPRFRDTTPGLRQALRLAIETFTD